MLDVKDSLYVFGLSVKQYNPLFEVAHSMYKLILHYYYDILRFTYVKNKTLLLSLLLYGQGLLLLLQMLLTP